MERADIPFLSATQLSQAIRDRDVSPIEALESYLDRIDDLDHRFNAYLTVCRKDALAAAQEAEREIASGRYRGPMHGIPVAVKDQMWTKGVRTTGGSTFFADFFPEEDSTPIANLKAAGGILLGKTNLTEFAIGGAQRFAFGRNPWDLDRFTGGSSMGSASATAAFLCATSLGEDTGGSIRRPAAWCGVVGLRPSWGRVSRYGLMPGSWSMDQVGPISRTVSDAAITLGAIAGHDPRDPYTWDVPVPDYTAALTGNIEGMRVGLVANLTRWDQVDPEVTAAVQKASETLGQLGATVEEHSLPLGRDTGTMAQVLINTEASVYHRERLRTGLQQFGRSNRTGLLTAGVMPAQAYYKVQKLRTLVRQQVLEALDKYDVLVMPTAKTAAPLVGDDPVITSKEMAAGQTLVLTRPFNLAGCPALSINCGFTGSGLPIGFQIGGRPFDEETVLRVAHAYEQATPWHTMRPPTA
ncbi:MAG: aspartyl/glutamyl-tRNA amidotransferase subunit A [Dehalococcoidia bacterium]|nr:aspartyl/glutamyl-tRNA amidotransferase subunit A [Dehalococcoidia bacterium]